jgi:hypothetical protein
VNRDVISSQDFARGGFAPHGELSVRFDDGLLLWLNRGPFNLEALQCYGQARQAAFERWALDERWVAGVVEWQGSALMSPDAFQAYRLGFERFMASHHTLVAVAWVARPEVEGVDFMRDYFAPLFERHDLPLRLFAAREPAVAWAREQLSQALDWPGAQPTQTGELR